MTSSFICAFSLIVARESKIPKDPKVYNELLENWALGMPKTLIAASLGLNVKTVQGWKNREDFNTDLAVKTLEILKEPIQKVRQSNPLMYLQIHPETREDFAPPKERRESEINIKSLVLENRTIENLITIAKRGSNRGGNLISEE